MLTVSQVAARLPANRCQPMSGLTGGPSRCLLDRIPIGSLGGVTVDCRTHPGTAAVATCAGCAESYCSNCLVDIRGARYCASCKSMAVTTPVAGEPCLLAGEALKYAIIGVFIFGIVLGPMAISKGLAAKKLISANPTMSGGGKATAAIIIGAASLGFWVLGLVAKMR